ncbi:hypothetical protein D3C80_544290 [compost metagenome]
MKSWGQKVAPKIWNLLSAKSQSTAWRPFQFNQTVPKNSKNRKPAPVRRRLRNKPVKLRVWIFPSLLAVFFLKVEGSAISTIWTGILSLMVRRSSGLDQARALWRPICLHNRLRYFDKNRIRFSCNNLQALDYRAWLGSLEVPATIHRTRYS